MGLLWLQTVCLEVLGYQYQNKKKHFADNTTFIEWKVLSLKEILATVFSV